jgi:hypothetical protein
VTNPKERRYQHTIDIGSTAPYENDNTPSLRNIACSSLSFAAAPRLRLLLLHGWLVCNTGLKTRSPPPLPSVNYLNRLWTSSEENLTYGSIVSALYEDTEGFTHCFGEPVGIMFNQDIALALWIMKVLEYEYVLVGNRGLETRE